LPHKIGSFNVYIVKNQQKGNALAGGWRLEAGGWRLEAEEVESSLSSESSLSKNAK
jgi:hypothetical protein